MNADANNNNNNYLELENWEGASHKAQMTNAR